MPETGTGTETREPAATSHAFDLDPREDDTVVLVQHLTREYRSFTGRLLVRALDDVSFHLRRGEVFGLLGPNGSGKTTSIKLMLGLLTPDAGKIRILGSPPHDVAVKQYIGYLPEETYLYRFLSADETLDFFGRLFHIPRRERKERIDELIERVGLNHARHRKLGEYSKGMARRLGLAQALINNPDLVILDEPTSGLDPIGTREVKNLILKMKEEGRTVLLSSHLLADVQDVCDRIGILFRGKMRSIGTVSELLAENDRVQFTASGLDESAVQEVKNAIRAAGGGDIVVQPPRERLEQYFLRIVRESETAGGSENADGDGTDPSGTSRSKGPEENASHGE